MNLLCVYFKKKRRYCVFCGVELWIISIVFVLFIIYILKMLENVDYIIWKREKEYREKRFMSRILWWWELIAKID